MKAWKSVYGVNCLKYLLKMETFFFNFSSLLKTFPGVVMSDQAHFFFNPDFGRPSAVEPIPTLAWRRGELSFVLKQSRVWK